MASVPEQWWHPLDEPRETLQRAERQIDDLEAAMDEWAKTHMQALGITHSRDATHEILHIPEIPQFPKSWGNDVSEIAVNTRSTLDYLIHQLAIANGMEADTSTAKTGFPIAVKRDDYLNRRKRGKRKLPSMRDRYLAGVDERWKKVIDELQPYNRTLGPRAHPLARLNRITNRGKHQTRNTPVLVVDTPGHTVAFDGRDQQRNVTIRYRDDDIDIQSEFRAGPPHPGTILGNLIYPNSRPQPNPRRIGAMFLGLPGADLLGTPDIRAIVEYVRDVVIANLAPAFEPPTN